MQAWAFPLSGEMMLDPSTWALDREFEWKHDVAKVVDWMFLCAGGSFGYTYAPPSWSRNRL